MGGEGGRGRIKQSVKKKELLLSSHIIWFWFGVAPSIATAKFTLRDPSPTWKIKTNGGYIQKDKRHSYKDDYFLSQTINDYDTHIHLITHKEDYSLYELIKLVFFQYSKIIFLEYIVKKNNVHSHLTQIDYYNDSYLDICEQMEYLLFGE